MLPCCLDSLVPFNPTGLQGQEHKSYTMCNTTTGPSSTRGHHHRPRTTHTHQSSLSVVDHIRYNRNTIQLCPPQNEVYVDDEDEKYSKMQKQLRAQRRTYSVAVAAVLLTGYAGICWGVSSSSNAIEANNRRSPNRPPMQHGRRHRTTIATASTTTPVVAASTVNRPRRTVPATVSPKLRAHFLEDSMTTSFAKRKQQSAQASGDGGGGVWSWFMGLFGLSYSGGSNDRDNGRSLYTYNEDTLQASLYELEMSIESNSYTNTFHWLNSKQPNSFLPSLDITRPNLLLDQVLGPPRSKYDLQTPYFKVKRQENTSIPMEWEDDYERHNQERKQEEASVGKASPRVDYTQLSYTYPTLPKDISSVLEEEENAFGADSKKMANYPPLRPLQEIFDTWPQDQLDTPPIQMLQETLYHFDYNDPEQMKQALILRDQKLPFKVINVPDLLQANMKWTDEYLSEQFDREDLPSSSSSSSSFTTPSTSTCQESSTNFFLHFQPSRWNVEYMGLPPTRENDWTFERWSQHAKYADLVGLGPEQPHYYYHGGVSREERTSFISNDLPCFSAASASSTATATSTTTSAPEDDPNGGGTFFIFSPRDSNGIQCRFGERGVTAAIHYDGGRNMVGMVTVSLCERLFGFSD